MRGPPSPAPRASSGGRRTPLARVVGHQRPAVPIDWTSGGARDTLNAQSSVRAPARRPGRAIGSAVPVTTRIGGPDGGCIIGSRCGVVRLR
jgi:hypothetical protein